MAKGHMDFRKRKVTLRTVNMLWVYIFSNNTVIFLGGGTSLSRNSHCWSCSAFLGNWKKTKNIPPVPTVAPVCETTLGWYFWIGNANVVYTYKVSRKLNLNWEWWNGSLYLQTMWIEIELLNIIFCGTLLTALRAYFVSISGFSLLSSSVAASCFSHLCFFGLAL